MADYKLRLEIDALELEKKLTEAFRKATKGFNFSGGAKDPLEKVTKQLDKINKLNDDVFKKETDILKLKFEQRKELEQMTKDRQIHIRLLAKENALIRATGSRQSSFRAIGGLLGNFGSAAGGAIDFYRAQRSKANVQKDIKRDFYKAQVQRYYGQEGVAPKMAMYDQRNRSKFERIMGSAKERYSSSRLGKSRAGGILSGGASKGASVFGKAMGTPVKIAGFAAGIFQQAGIAKALIDASPMLQSMMKLLNVGINLILRPIGDFIGFMLRPLLIEFVKKVAVPAYRTGAQAAKEWGTKVGKALVMLFTDPGEFFSKGIINPLLKGLSAFYYGIMKWFADLGADLNFLEGNKEAAKQKNQLEYEKNIASLNDPTSKNFIPTLWDNIKLPEKVAAGMKELTGEIYDELPTRPSMTPGVTTGQGITCVNSTIYPWEANTSATDKNTCAVKDNTAKLNLLIEQSKAKNPEFFPGTPEYNKRNFGYEDVTSFEEAKKKGMDIYTKGLETKRAAAIKAQMEYAIKSKNYTGLTKEQIIEAERSRAAGIYGDSAKPYAGIFANPLYEKGGYLGTQTSAERQADLGKGDKALEQQLLDKKMEQIYGKEKWAQIKARGNKTGYNCGGMEESSTRHITGSGGLYSPAKGTLGINPKTGKTWTAYDLKQIGQYSGADPNMQPLMSSGGKPTKFIDGSPISLSLDEEIKNIDEEFGKYTTQLSDNTKEHTTLLCESLGFGETVAKTTNKLGQSMMNEKFCEQSSAVQTKIATAQILDEMDSAEGYINETEQTASNIADGFIAIWNKVQKALNQMKLVTTSTGKTPYKAEATATIAALNESVIADRKSNYEITWSTGQSRVLQLDKAGYDYYNNLRGSGKGNILSIRKLAKGGIINEPVLGFGQNTGRQYLMGENGPETITPGANTNIQGGGNIFNITIHASNTGDIERQLKPAILRMLKESTARVGIV